MLALQSRWIERLPARYLLALPHCTTTQDRHVRAAVTPCNIIQTFFFDTNTMGTCTCPSILTHFRNSMHPNISLSR